MTAHHQTHKLYFVTILLLALIAQPNKAYTQIHQAKHKNWPRRTLREFFFGKKKKKLTKEEFETAYKNIVATLNASKHVLAVRTGKADDTEQSKPREITLSLPQNTQTLKKMISLLQKERNELAFRLGKTQWYDYYWRNHRKKFLFILLTGLLAGSTAAKVTTSYLQPTDKTPEDDDTLTQDPSMSLISFTQGLIQQKEAAERAKSISDAQKARQVVAAMLGSGEETDEEAGGGEEESKE